MIGHEKQMRLLMGAGMGAMQRLGEQGDKRVGLDRPWDDRLSGETAGAIYILRSRRSATRRPTSGSRRRAPRRCRRSGTWS